MSPTSWKSIAIACALLTACGTESDAPHDGDDAATGGELQWGPPTGDAGSDEPTVDGAVTSGDAGTEVPPDPCATGQTKPCFCEDGGTGLQLCDGGPDAPCDCATCPGAEPLTSSGFLVTSTGQYLFEHGQVTLTHRAGPPSGGGGCIASASVSLAAGTPEAPGCALTFEASGDASPEGSLPLTSLRFDADASCLGLPESEHGTYTVTDFSLGELFIVPAVVDGGADAECWTGQLTARMEALMAREDGHPMTLSVSEVQATGSGLSVGLDVLCPGVDVPVDLNDCEKEIPLFSNCNPYCQLGCDPGEQCVVDAAFFTCHPVGTLGFGEVCTNPAACGPGLSCFALPNTDIPVCHMPCVDDDDCPGDAQCAVTANLGGGSDLTLCATPHQDCDALAQTGCEGDTTCYLDGASMLCLPGGTMAAGEVCEDLPANTCAPGLHCLVICRELCSTTNQSPSCAACPDGHHEFSLAMGLGFCLDGNGPALCDLYQQLGCSDGEGCYPVPGGVACRDAGEITPGLACTSGDSCTPGYACVSDACRLLCDLSADEAAATSCASRCESFTTPDGESHLSVGAIEPTSWGMGVCVDL